MSLTELISNRIVHDRLCFNLGKKSLLMNVIVQSEFVPLNGRFFATYKSFVYKCTMSIAVDVLNFSVIANQSNTSGLSSVIERYTDEQLGSLQLFKGYPKPLLQFTAVCCMLFMIIGIPGNLVTIFALARCKKVSFFVFSSVYFYALYTLILNASCTYNFNINISN